MAPVNNNTRKRNKHVQAGGGKASMLSIESLTKLINCILFERKYLVHISLGLLFIEIIINFLIIQFVNYTEIDWKTYMQQVECFLNGTLDYSQISGDTGPIVYPAGHLYVYTGLYYLTDAGRNIKLAQYLFGLLYIANLAVIHAIYRENNNIPPFVLMLISFTSYRVHSLFVLRLFNDAVSMFLLYVAVYCFMKKRWTIGSAFFSVAVSIKMNILLFAPGLLIVLVEYCCLVDVIKNLFTCAVIQLIFAGPFLVTYPVSYIRSSFNLGRVFMHKWTVNWRFMPEEMFVSKSFHLTLLCLHIAVLLLVFSQRWRNVIVRLFRQCLRYESKVGVATQKSSVGMLVTLFTANLIGIAFSRSLHYQFYLWYYHTIPLLLWSTQYRVTTKLCMWGVIELVWKVYPSTYWSSALLHVVHLALIVGLWRNRYSNGLASQQTKQA